MNAPARLGPAVAEPIALSYAAQLLNDGYVIIPDLVDQPAVQAIDKVMRDRFALTGFCEGPFYGSKTKRFGRLLAHAPEAPLFVQHPLILGIVDHVLSPWCDVFQLNLTQAVEVHPGSPQQVPHRDQDMWQGPKGEVEYLVNVMWPTTDYTKHTGATAIWPGSHAQQNEMILPENAATHAEMRPGSALLYLGSTLHAAGFNASDEIRRGMIVSYSLGWLKPYENQWLAYPPDIARGFSQDLAALVGYQQHRPNLGNYEGQCPSVLLQEDVPEHLNAVDALRPDQVALIDAYRSGEFALNG